MNPIIERRATANVLMAEENRLAGEGETDWREIGAGRHFEERQFI
jgi:hypothetical protein